MSRKDRVWGTGMALGIPLGVALGAAGELLFGGFAYLSAGVILGLLLGCAIALAMEFFEARGTGRD